ncbi:MAG: inositol monophosphatase family protein [Pseudomonadota bacterium]
MPQNDYQFDDLVRLQEIIRQVAESNLDVYYRCSTADYKSDGSIVTEADLAMQTGLTEALLQHYPDVLMLGEEIPESEQLAVIQGEQEYWCLDPVDGTTNFHATMPLFSVSLGLVRQGEMVLAIIFDPNRNEFFAAIKGKGMWVNQKPVERPKQPETLSNSIAFVDFKRLSENLSSSLVQQSPYKSQRNIGTCALEWAWLASGRANLLVHGREKLWDYAAGVLLVSEAGGVSETFDGEPIFNQSLAPRSVIAASTPELFDEWATKIRSAL